MTDSVHFVIAGWRAKEADSTPHEVLETLVFILLALSASFALADDFKTNNGKEYKDATVTQIEPDGIVVKTKSGISKLYFQELPRDVQKRFNYDPQQAAAYSAQQNAVMQKSSEQLGKEQLVPSGRPNSDKTLGRCNCNYKRFNKKNTIRWNTYVY